MKKVFILGVVLVIALGGIHVLAEPCPLPPANTDAEINFNGFEWYTDYPATKKAAAGKGLSDTWFNDFFYDDYCTTPHWPIVYTDFSSFAGSEKRCGGSISYYSDIPDVAGYRVKGLDLYMMWNPETGYTTEYAEPGATQFYMAKYEIDVSDTNTCYADLVGKLKSIYGENPHSDVHGTFSPTAYTVWVNDLGAMVGVGADRHSVYLVYMAPGAEEKLVEVERLVERQEIETAQGDISGL